MLQGKECSQISNISIHIKNLKKKKRKKTHQTIGKIIKRRKEEERRKEEKRKERERREKSMKPKTTSLKRLMKLINF